MKWGVIKADGKEILPCIYDQIARERLGEFWRLEKGGKYGLADYNGKIVLEVAYDNLIPDEDLASAYTIIDKGKYGFISPYSKCYPLFTHKIVASVLIGKYTIFKVVAKDGRPLGYADKKGFLYFKE